MKRIYHLVVSNSCDLTVAYIGTCFTTWRLWVHWKRRMRATRAFITLFGDHIATLIGRYHGAFLVWNLDNTLGGLSERTQTIFLEHEGDWPIEGLTEHSATVEHRAI